MSFTERERIASLTYLCFEHDTRSAAKVHRETVVWSFQDRLGILWLDVPEVARAMRAASSLPTQAGEVRTMEPAATPPPGRVVSAEAR
jgi:hypothetical protein